MTYFAMVFVMRVRLDLNDCEDGNYRWLVPVRTLISAWYSTRFLLAITRVRCFSDTFAGTLTMSFHALFDGGVLE